MEFQTVIGAGSFGLVTSHTSPKLATKLFYDLNDCKAILKEAALQEKARKLLKSIVRVPRIHETSTLPTTFKTIPYLQGLVMDRVPLVDTFTSAVHIVLGYDHDDIDVEWARDNVNPPSEDNPTRGFHASPEMMEAIWEERMPKYQLTL